MSQSRGKRSIVWDYYNKATDSHVVTCNLCNQSYRHFGNTTNLIWHLKRKHPVEFMESNSANLSPKEFTQCSTPSTSGSVQDIAIVSVMHVTDDEEITTPTRSKRKRKSFASTSRNLPEAERKFVDDAIFEMVILDCQPLHSVEKPGFKLFLEKICPQYASSAQKCLMQEMLSERYQLERIAIEQKLENVDHIALRTDMWSSGSSISYLTVTANFIFDFKMYSINLSTMEFQFKHSSINIAKTIRDMIDSWKINGKIVAIVTDNTVNIQEAVSKRLKLQNIVCVAHTLNSAVDECIQSYPEFFELLQSCRKIIEFINANPEANNKLKELQEQMKLPEITLEADKSTRWNSTLSMVQTLMDTRTPLSAALALLESSPDDLDPDQWNLMTDLIAILQPIDKVAKELSAENYGMLSCSIPLIRGLDNAIKNKSLLTQIGKNLQSTLLTFIDKHLGVLEVNDIAAKASFLDPRFKKMGFGSEINAQKAMQSVIKELAATSGIDSSDYEVKVSSQTIVVNTDSDDELWENFNKKVSECLSSTPISSSSVIVNQYLELPLLNRKDDPFEFWQLHSQVFPELSKLALMYLCIPATSLPPERIFTKSGEIWNQDRNRIDLEKLDEVLFLNSCLTSKYQHLLIK